MSLERQILLVMLCYLLSFFYIRMFIWGVIGYQLNNSALKKRRKGLTFKEWLFYTRYREEIPKVLIAVYMVMLLIHPIVLITCVVLYFLLGMNEVGPMLAKGVSLFFFGWRLIYFLMFWSPRPGIPFERWIKKKRGTRKR